MTQHSRGTRRGSVFSVRISDEEREALEALQGEGRGPRSLGPWLVWRALRGESPTRAKQHKLERGTTGARTVVPAPAARIILDLCGGSGSWSMPYRRAGYDVRLITLANPGGLARDLDVRVFRPPSEVWGVLAAPPCTEFSIATNGRTEKPRDFVEGMACVNACMRIVLQCKPRWWALENPTGLLAQYLGPPRDVWQPCDFGDPWTKQTAIWGSFAIPKRGPFVEPKGSAMQRSTPAKRAMTPPGFARAFYEANP